VDAGIDKRDEALNQITASSARYIKLGTGGAFEHLCLEDGTLRLEYNEVPHDLAVRGSHEEIKQYFANTGAAPRSAANHARQVHDFYHAPEDTLWITFSAGRLWWCFARPGVEFLGYDPVEHPDGSRLRRTVDGWHDASVQGQTFHMNMLSGRLTKSASYQMTICNVEAFDYLLQKINGQTPPAIAHAERARGTVLASIQELLKLLDWRSFETLIELVFAQSGWRRIGETGGAQKTVDIELILPTTGEQAFVQVKSSTAQKQFDDYLERFAERLEDRMFYVFHSSKSPIRCDADNVTLIGPEQLAPMILQAGLFDWLLEKAG